MHRSLFGQCPELPWAGGKAPVISSLVESTTCWLKRLSVGGEPHCFSEVLSKLSLSSAPVLSGSPPLCSDGFGDTSAARCPHHVYPTLVITFDPFSSPNPAHFPSRLLRTPHLLSGLWKEGCRMFLLLLLGHVLDPGENQSVLFCCEDVQPSLLLDNSS